MSGLVAPWLADPWVWAGVAVTFMLAELAIPGFLMLGFGLAALGMAAAVAFGVVGLIGPLGQLLIWAAASLAAWWALSRAFGRRARRAGARDVNDFENR